MNNIGNAIMAGLVLTGLAIFMAGLLLGFALPEVWSWLTK